jgi:drug/metabolite transporter (DMT)-like permease
LGILLMVTATTLFSFMWALAKVLSARYPIVEVTFFRSIFGFLPVSVMVATHGGWAALRVHKFPKHVWRTILGVTGLGLGIFSYHLMPLADAVAISFASPLVVTALSMPLLGERVGLYRWTAVIVGFVGVLIIVRPGGDMFNLGAVAAVVAACLTGLVYITLRQLNRIDRPVTIVFYFILLSSVFTSIPLPFVWVAPTMQDWGLAAALGLCGGCAQYCMTRAFGLARAAVISPFGYMGLLWSGLLGWLIWNDVPGVNVFLGAPIVIGSGLAILYRETGKSTG